MDDCMYSIHFLLCFIDANTPTVSRKGTAWKPYVFFLNFIYTHVVYRYRVYHVRMHSSDVQYAYILLLLTFPEDVLRSIEQVPFLHVTGDMLMQHQQKDIEINNRT